MWRTKKHMKHQSAQTATQSGVSEWSIIPSGRLMIVTARVNLRRQFGIGREATNTPTIQRLMARFGRPYMPFCSSRQSCSSRSREGMDVRCRGYP